MRVTMLLAILVPLLATPARAMSWHVPDEFDTIQEALDVSTAGDSVIVACGTYYHTGIMMKCGVVLCSETGDPSCVTLDSEGPGERLPVHIEDCDSTTVIEGLTITDGAPGYRCYGGGVYIRESIVEIWRCDIVDNVACGMGGGVAIRGSSVKIIESVVRGNENGGDGGGVYAEDSSLEMIDSAVRDNYGGQGGGLYATGSSVELTRCRFIANWTDTNGGGIEHGYNDSPLRMTDCVFEDNESSHLGGAINVFGSGGVVATGCIFHENYSGSRGGAAVRTESGGTFERCTFVKNVIREGDEDSAGAIFVGGLTSFDRCIVAHTVDGPAFGFWPGDTPTLTCSDLYGNAGGDWVDELSDQLGVNGNISAAPLFCGPVDFSLCEESPCAPGQHPDGYDCGTIGALGVGCMCPVPTREVSWGEMKSKFHR